MDEVASELGKFAMEVKGLEFSMYITKESLAQQGGYGFALKGPQHDEAWLIFIDQVYNEIPEIERDCKSGALGCVACKNNLSEKLALYLTPFREKREYYEQHLDEVMAIIDRGNAVAQKVARETMNEVYKVMKLG